MAMTPEQKKAASERAKAMWAKIRAEKGAAQEQTLARVAPTVEPSLEVANALRDTAESGIPVPEEGKPETHPVNLFGGFTKRLDFDGMRKGFMYWWCNDDKGGTTMANALKSGWTMVERKDVQLNAAVTPRNNDLGSHVRQYVGTNESDGPMYAYLLEKPEWLYKLHEFGPGSREEYHQHLQDQIKSGTIGMKAGEKRYTATNPYPGAGPSKLPATTFETKTTR